MEIQEKARIEESFKFEEMQVKMPRNNIHKNAEWLRSEMKVLPLAGYDVQKLKVISYETRRN